MVYGRYIELVHLLMAKKTNTHFTGGHTWETYDGFISYGTLDGGHAALNISKYVKRLLIEYYYHILGNAHP